MEPVLMPDADSFAVLRDGILPFEPYARASEAEGRAPALAAVGVSANVTAGFDHDLVVVAWDQSHAALDALRELSRA